MEINAARESELLPIDGSEASSDSENFDEGFPDLLRFESPERKLGPSVAGMGKVPPHSLEAEQSVIGAVLIDNDSINQVIEVLAGPEDFYVKAHRLIFEGMVELYDNGHPIDIISLSNILKGKGNLSAAGGLNYLSQLIDIVPTSANVGYYTRLVRGMALRRYVIHQSGQIVEEAFDLGMDVDAFIDSVEQRILQVSDSRISQGFSRVSDIVKDAIKDIEKRVQNQDPITGVPTGFVDLDMLTSGFQPGDLIIIAGRPSMGKTSLAMSMVRNVAMEHGLGVAVFSLEMSREQIVTRLLCSESKVNSSKVRSGNLKDAEFPKLVDAASRVAPAPIFVDDISVLSILEMRAKARRLHRECPLKLIVVDYLQLMRGSQRKVERSREQEISEISRGLKALAKELRVPVVALSQLNRSVENRNDKRPIMADLRESGAIEQDADIIGFVYRDEVYNPDTPDKGVAEIIIAKHRNGAVGTVRLAFQNEFTTFENLAEEDSYDYLGENGSFSSEQDDEL